MRELNDTVSDSGLEVAQYYVTLISTSGMNVRSSLAIELQNHLMSLHFLHVLDGLNGYRLTVAEHIARRAMMIIKAVQRCAKAPDFIRLDAYCRHLPDSGLAVRTGDFDRYNAGEQRSEAQILKQSRLAQEEGETEQQRKNTRAKKGGKGAKKEGEEE